MPGEVHLAAAAGPRDPPEVDVSVTTGGDQGGVRLTEGHVVDIEIFPLAGAQQGSLLPPPDWDPVVRAGALQAEQLAGGVEGDGTEEEGGASPDVNS